MVQQGGSDFWVVSCISSGGRPDTDISLALNTEEELQTENTTVSDRQTSSVLLPTAVYEGHNVTCVFDHPKFVHKVSQVVTLPSFCECVTFQENTLPLSSKLEKTQMCSLLCRFVRSPTVEIRSGRKRSWLTRHWIFGAAGRTEWHHHQPAGHWECAALQPYLSKVRKLWL